MFRPCRLVDDVVVAYWIAKLSLVDIVHANTVPRVVTIVVVPRVLSMYIPSPFLVVHVF